MRPTIEIRRNRRTSRWAGSGSTFGARLAWRASKGRLLPPGVGVDVDDVAVLSEAIDEGTQAGGVGEDVAPLLVGEVGGEDDGALLVTATDDPEEKIGCACIAGNVSELIEDEHVWGCVTLQAALGRRE